MTQKEIKKEMTTGEWVCDTSLTNIGSIATKCIEISSNKASWWVAYVQDDKYCKNSGEHDAAAIVSAINNTYGKGINPESVVNMFNALAILEIQLRKLGLNELAASIQDILNKATL